MIRRWTLDVKTLARLRDRKAPTAERQTAEQSNTSFCSMPWFYSAVLYFAVRRECAVRTVTVQYCCTAQYLLVHGECALYREFKIKHRCKQCPSLTLFPFLFPFFLFSFSTRNSNCRVAMNRTFLTVVP